MNNLVVSNDVGSAVEDFNKSQLQEQVDRTLSEAKKILFKIDSAVDRLEGNAIHKAILEIHDLLLDWQLLGSNFATLGIQDWINPEGD